MARPKDLGLEHTWRTRSRAEGDSRSAANKAWQHESRSGRQRARGDPTGRVGVVGPTHPGSILAARRLPVHLPPSTGERLRGQDRRDEVDEALTGPRAGLVHQVPPLEDDLGDRTGQSELLGTGH